MIITSALYIVGENDIHDIPFGDMPEEEIQDFDTRIKKIIETDDFEYAPFSQEGGLGKVYQLFGDDLNNILDELNEALAA